MGPRQSAGKNPFRRQDNMVTIRHLVRVTIALQIIAAGVTPPVFAQTATAFVTSQEVKAGTALERRARLDIRELSLEDALTRLYQTSGVPISFSPSLLQHRQTVS